MNWWRIGSVVVAGLGIFASASYATPALKLGLGMENMGWKWTAVDTENRYLHSLWQATLAVSTLNFFWGDFRFGAEAGWSDWNLSGEWQGTAVEHFSPEPFYWGENKLLRTHLAYQLLAGLEAEVAFSQQQLRHYAPPSELTFFNVAWQQGRVNLAWQFIRRPDLHCTLTGVWIPWSHAWYEFITLGTIPPGVLAPVRTWTQGMGGGVSLGMAYQHAQGWGFALVAEYVQTVQQAAASLSELDIKATRLQGVLSYSF